MRAPSHHRVPLVAATLMAALAIALPMLAPPVPRLVYNGSASAPLGFYRLLAGTSVARGDLVLAHLPKPAAQLAARRRYLPLSVPAVKRVVAIAGDVVCVESGTVAIGNRVVAQTLRADSEGRSLPSWHGCRVLAGSEVFLLMADVPASFDSRYFGPIPAHAIIGRLVPLWTW